MDPNQPINPIDTQPKKTLSKKTILMVVVYVLMLISLPLFVYYSQKQQDIRQHAAEPTSEPLAQLIPSFPIARSLIENSMLSEWSGHIIGRVVKTVPYSITITPMTQVIAVDGKISLEDTVNGYAYTISYESPTSRLYKLPQKITDQAIKDAPELKFSDLNSGDIINGNVNLVKTKDKWKMVANNINISSDSSASGALAKSYTLYDNAPDLYTLIRQAPFDILYANTNGSVESKTNDSFVLVKGQGRLTINVQESQGITTFNDKSEVNQLNPTKPHFVDLKVGQTVSGGIGIIVTKQNTLNPGDIVAHYMTIEK